MTQKEGTIPACRGGRRGRAWRGGLVLAAVTAALPIVAAIAQDGGASVKTVTGTLIDSTGQPAGVVQLNQSADGTVSILLDASKLPAGPHGIHVHAAGVCEGPAFTSAAGHLNPGGKQHGLNNPAGPHAGDLPQIDETSVTNGFYRAATKAISLTDGPTSIFDADGTALVVHQSADDQVTDPTGNSGGRIACAVLAAPAPKTPVAPGPPNTGTGLEDGDSTVPVAMGAGLIVVAGALVAGRAMAGRRS